MTENRTLIYDGSMVTSPVNLIGLVDEPNVRVVSVKTVNGDTKRLRVDLEADALAFYVWLTIKGKHISMEPILIY